MVAGAGVVGLYEVGAKIVAVIVLRHENRPRCLNPEPVGVIFADVDRDGVGLPALNTGSSMVQTPGQSFASNWRINAILPPSVVPLENGGTGLGVGYLIPENPKELAAQAFVGPAPMGGRAVFLGGFPVHFAVHGIDTDPIPVPDPANGAATHLPRDAGGSH